MAFIWAGCDPIRRLAVIDSVLYGLGDGYILKEGVRWKAAPRGDYDLVAVANLAEPTVVTAGRLPEADVQVGRHYFVHEGTLYTLGPRTLSAWYLWRDSAGKLRTSQKVVASVTENARLFKGCVLQPLLESVWAFVPVKGGIASLNVKEWRGCRIVDMQVAGPWVAALVEKRGQFECHLLLVKGQTYTLFKYGTQTTELMLTATETCLALLGLGDTLVLRTETKEKQVQAVPIRQLASRGNAVLALTDAGPTQVKVA